MWAATCPSTSTSWVDATEWGHGDTEQGSGGQGRGHVLTGVWLVPGFELGSFSPAC